MGKHSVQNQRKRSLALRKIYKKKYPHTRFKLDSKSVHKIVTTQIRSGILEEIWSDIPDLTNIVEVEMEEEGSDQESESESESDDESSSEEEEESSNIETSKEGTSSQDESSKEGTSSQDENCEEGRGDEGVSNNDQDNLTPIAELLVSSEDEENDKARGEIESDSDSDEYIPPPPTPSPPPVLKPIHVVKPFTRIVDSPASPDADDSDLPPPPTPGTSSISSDTVWPVITITDE